MSASTKNGNQLGKENPMGANTKIEWCRHTWNPWFGCSKVSPACDFCYAEAMMATQYKRVRWGTGEARQRTSASNWREPFRWNKEAEAARQPASVFCLSLGDIWDHEVDPEWRSEAFSVMESTPWLVYLLLSKRIGNAVKMCYPSPRAPKLPANAALGSTMVNQQEWDRDLPKLKHAVKSLGARFSFASVEPMLGPINTNGNLPDWVIVGGESGSKARAMHPDWARSMRDQCAKAKVPFFFKQWGEWVTEIQSPPQITLPGESRGPWATLNPKTQEWGGDTLQVYKVGKKSAGALLDGVEHKACRA
jgi:protein gp37